MGVRFKSGVGAVMHVESGSCVGCRGAENARRQIHNFVSSSSKTRPFLTPMLLDRDGLASGPSERPYRCTCCPKTFRQMSALMQHMTDKHCMDPPRLALGY